MPPRMLKVASAGWSSEAGMPAQKKGDHGKPQDRRGADGEDRIDLPGLRLALLRPTPEQNGAGDPRQESRDHDPKAAFEHRRRHVEAAIGEIDRKSTRLNSSH